MSTFLKLVSDNKYCFEIEDNIKEIAKLEFIFDELSSAWKLNDKLKFNINIIVEEVLSNIILHAVFSNEKKKIIKVLFEIVEGKIILIISDNAQQFNPLQKDSEPSNKPIAEQEVGGLGIYFIKQLTKAQEYNRVDDLNVLKLEIVR